MSKYKKEELEELLLVKKVSYEAAGRLYEVSGNAIKKAAKGYTRSFEKVKEELDKCILVCSNCHKEIHAGLVSV